MVAGDFDGDGRTDLAVTSEAPALEGIVVLPGRGDGSFGPARLTPENGNVLELAAGDFDGDGRTDLAAGAFTPSVGIYLGRGDGTFHGPDTGAMPAAAAFVAGDFDGDGRPDLIARSGLSGGLFLFPGHGDGTFEAVVPIPSAAAANAVVARDFNGDGRLDLVVGTDTGVDILLGLGDGTFRAPALVASGLDVTSLLVGDFDGDGRTDLVVSASGTATPAVGGIFLLSGRGDGTFGSPKPVVSGDLPASVVTADFNGDGRPDLAFNTYASAGGVVKTLINAAHGAFRSPATVNAGGSAGKILVGDINGDGIPDLAAEASNGDFLLSLLPGRGDGTFSDPVSLPSIDPNQWLVMAQLEGKGLPVLGLFDRNSKRLTVTIGPFAPHTGPPPFPVPVPVFFSSPFIDIGPYSVPFAVQTAWAADMNGDGRPDLILPTLNATDEPVLLNLGDGTLADPGTLATAVHSNPLLADLDGDGAPDVVVLNQAGRILWRRGQPRGPGTFAPPITVNPDNPARDVAVVRTALGPVVAAVAARGAQVSLYADRGGRFVTLGHVATGRLPAQILSSDMNGDGRPDLVVRNAGDDTVSLLLGDGRGGFAPAGTVPVGADATDVSLADLNGDGRPDLVVSNAASGVVRVFPNQGGAAFGGPSVYLASPSPHEADPTTGLTAPDTPQGVAAGRFTAGGAADLVVLNTGTDSLAVLPGLGTGAFANARGTGSGTGPATQAVRTADLNGDGVSDVVTLDASGVDVRLGDGRGVVRGPTHYAAGADPTGLSVADANRDGAPDLLVGNTFGDVLVLLGNGDGTFQPSAPTDRQVALAVASPAGAGTPVFVFADQALDRVVAVPAGGPPTVLAEQRTGLLAPAAVRLWDLNDDGVPDLIVANSGGNDVLVYPGLRGGRFGPALNGSDGFATGTNPVGVTVADVNGDGAPDLIVANSGSNDVSILLNQRQGDALTFAQGPRLKVGAGPVASLVQDVNGDRRPDLLVSNSASNTVSLLPGVGSGFFNDQSPTTFPVGTDPGPIFVGNFDGRPDIVTVNAGSNDLTLISDFTGASPLGRSIPTGGEDPVAAFAFQAASGFDDLVVANEGDGVLALLEGGPDGLSVTSTRLEPGLPRPSALALSAFTGGQVDFYATTEGVEAASLLAFRLSGGPSAASAGTRAQLTPLEESPLALVGTLLPLTLNLRSTEEFVTEAESPETTALSVGQSVPARDFDDSAADDGLEPPDVPAIPPAAGTDDPAAWEPFVIGLQEDLDQLRARAREPQPVSPSGPGAGGPVGSPSPARPDDTSARVHDAALDLMDGEASGRARVETPTAPSPRVAPTRFEGAAVTSAIGPRYHRPLQLSAAVLAVALASGGAYVLRRRHDHPRFPRPGWR
jgi:hypothetical protein